MGPIPSSCAIAIRSWQPPVKLKIDRIVRRAADRLSARAGLKDWPGLGTPSSSGSSDVPDAAENMKNAFQGILLAGLRHGVGAGTDALRDIARSPHERRRRDQYATPSDGLTASPDMGRPACRRRPCSVRRRVRLGDINARAVAGFRSSELLTLYPSYESALQLCVLARHSARRRPAAKLACTPVAP